MAGDTYDDIGDACIRHTSLAPMRCKRVGARPTWFELVVDQIRTCCARTKGWRCVVIEVCRDVVAWECASWKGKVCVRREPEACRLKAMPGLWNPKYVVFRGKVWKHCPYMLGLGAETGTRRSGFVCLDCWSV
jgi:hypothetical protein